MRIAAGVLLVLVSFLNGCAGLGYLAAGGCAATVGAVGSQALENGGTWRFDGGSVEVSPEQTKATVTDLRKVEAAGGGIAGFGLFLVVMLGLQMAAAVCLFTSRAPTFVLVVGVLGVLAEIGGFAIFAAIGDHVKATPIWSHLPGLVASGLAVVAALGLKKAPASTLPAA